MPSVNGPFQGQPFLSRGGIPRSVCVHVLLEEERTREGLKNVKIKKEKGKADRRFSFISRFFISFISFSISFQSFSIRKAKNGLKTNSRHSRTDFRGLETSQMGRKSKREFDDTREGGRKEKEKKNIGRAGV
jgi:hypothetical protein